MSASRTKDERDVHDMMRTTDRAGHSPARTPLRWRRLAIAMVATAFVTTACGSGTAPSTGAVAASHPSNAPASAADPSSTAPSIQPSARAEPTPIPIWTGPGDRGPGAPGQCDTPGRPCQFTAGTYQTYGRWAFLPGLTMDVPDGWNSTEQDAGEFNLNNPDYPDSGLFFWRDMVPVEPDGTHLTTVPSTVVAITDWLRADSQLVVTDPIEEVIGKGLDTTTFVVEVARGAVNMDPGCAAKPAKPTCFPILTDPAHWGDGAWWVASTHSTRYYLATVGPSTNRHLLVVAVVGSTMDPGPHVEADPAAERLRFEEAVAPILDSLDVSHVTLN
jgi:hypothetical protein